MYHHPSVAPRLCHERVCGVASQNKIHPGYYYDDDDYCYCYYGGLLAWAPLSRKNKSLLADCRCAPDDVMCTKRTFPPTLQSEAWLGPMHRSKQDLHRTHTVSCPSHLTFRILRQTFSAEQPDCISDAKPRFVSPHCVTSTLQHCHYPI